MEIRQLKTLVNVLDYGGFAAAGESIGLTQSAISLQIKALEEELGESLFDRSKRPPMPNAKGIALAKKAREILHMCNDLSDFSTEKLSGSLQLGAVPSVHQSMLPKALKHMRETHPDLFISITTGLSDELCRSVHRGVLDAAIVSEPTKLVTGMSWHPFATETLVLIAPDYITEADPFSILSNYPYIQFIRSAWAGELITIELRNLGIRVKTVVETDNLNSIWEMVSCGMGVAIVPQHLIYDKPKVSTNDSAVIAEKQGIKMIKLHDNPTQLVTGLIERARDPKSHLIAGLYEALLT